MSNVYERFGNNIAQGLYAIADAKEKKKQLTQEQAYRLAAMKYQQDLQDQALTPEMKTMRGLGLPMSIEGVRQLQMAQNPMASQEMQLKQQALGIQQQEANSQNAYRQAQMAAMGDKSLPGRIQEARYWQTQINPKTGKPYTLDEIQQFLYKPPFQFDFSGGGGTPNLNQ